MRSPGLDVLNRNIYFQAGHLAIAHLYNHGFSFGFLCAYIQVGLS
jgi:hypothetical protein